MTRPITLFTGQWADLPFEEVARLAGEWGYDGLEIACWGDHLDVSRWDDAEYVQSRLDILERNGLRGLRDLEPPDRAGGVRRPDRRAPPRHPVGSGVGRRRPGRGAARAAEDLKDTAPVRREARRHDGQRLHRVVDLEGGRDVPAGVGRVDRRRLPGLRRPVEPDPRRVRGGRRAVRARGAPVRDRLRLLDGQAPRSRRSVTARASASTSTRRTSCGSSCDPVAFVLDFADHIFHVHVKESITNLDGRNGVLGSHLPWANPRRGWTFVSTGHGAVPWEPLFRALNAIGYDGPTSVEWEDAGMDRLARRARGAGVRAQAQRHHAARRRLRRRVLDQGRVAPPRRPTSDLEVVVRRARRTPRRGDPHDRRPRCAHPPGHMTREHDNEFRSFRQHNQWLTTLLEDTGRFRVRVIEDPRGLGAEIIDRYDVGDRRVRGARRLPREGRRLRGGDGCRAAGVRARPRQGHRVVPRLRRAGGRLGLPRGVQRHARLEADRRGRAAAAAVGRGAARHGRAAPPDHRRHQRDAGR